MTVNSGANSEEPGPGDGGRFAAVVMDVDGTLARSDHLLSERTRLAVAGLQAARLTGIIVTGRTERAALAVARSCELTAPVISAGGAVVTDGITEKRLHVATWPASRAHNIVEVAKRWNCQPLLWTIDGPFAEVASSTTRLLEELVSEPVRIADFDHLLATADVIKVVVSGPPELLDEVGGPMERLVPELKRSTATFYDAPPPGSSKAESLAFVLARLGIQPGRCAGIGDGDADIEWLSMVGHPVAMANASPGVLAIAAQVIGDHDSEGVASYLEQSFLRH